MPTKVAVCQVPDIREDIETSLNYLVSAIFRLRINSIHALELRPSFVFYERPYQGAELGLFYRLYLLKRFFLYAGIVGHYGTEGPHGASSFHNGESGWVPTYGFGVGIFEKLAISFNAYLVKNVHSYNMLLDSYRYNGDTTIYKWWKDWLLSFGIEYNY